MNVAKQLKHLEEMVDCYAKAMVMVAPQNKQVIYKGMKAYIERNSLDNKELHDYLTSYANRRSGYWALHQEETK